MQPRHRIIKIAFTLLGTLLLFLLWGTAVAQSPNEPGTSNPGSSDPGSSDLDKGTVSLNDHPLQVL